MQENQENFDGLKRLLALKKHELPPPRFHDELRGRILARIEAGEAGAPVSWWRRFIESFELRPALATGFASALCGLLVAAIYYGSRPGEASGPELAIDPQPAGETEEMAIYNPFTATNAAMTSPPPPGIFDPQLGRGLQHVSKTNFSVPRR